MSISLYELDSVFAAEGPLGQRIRGYQPRREQVELANAVKSAIEQSRHLVAEAGTGTGKTFAYLVPAILSGKRTVVSTGTRNLQDQLFSQDLPLLREVLAVPFSAALLKGRNNYLCHYRFANVAGFFAGHTEADASALAEIQRWAKSTVNGDIAEVVGVPENSPIWSAVTSTADNCLGQECPLLSECRVARARRKALDAELVVINHHLLCADWTLRNDGYGELLPRAELVIVDEAHQLPETATRFLGQTFSTRQIEELSQDILAEVSLADADQDRVASTLQQLDQAAHAVRLAAGSVPQRGLWDDLEQAGEPRTRLQQLSTALRALAGQLEPTAVNAKGVDSCKTRAEALADQVDQWLTGSEEQSLQWFEVHRRSVTFTRTPLNIAEQVTDFLERSQAVWVFTSATLAVNGRFDHFTSAIGIPSADSRQWDSPFDYARQTLLYAPPDLPDPNANDYTAAVVRASLPVLEASEGRAFMLFTSHRALLEAAEELGRQTSFPLFLQGRESKGTLLERFKRSGNGVLLGTASFWEGVDVRGPALSCVIIDRLPFGSPGDPVTQARLDALQRSGDNPFMAYQIPRAVIALKQGVGRLIRDVADRGVLVLCDPRLLSKSYGAIFLNSLPPMPRTRNLERVRAFFKSLAERSA